MSSVALAMHQMRFDQKSFWRNPAAVFFTVAFPVLLLVIFAAVFGDDELEGLGVRTTTYYVPAIVTLAVVSSTMQNLVMNLVMARENGRLKRGRGTPMPSWVFIAGRVSTAILLALLMLVLITLLGSVVYGVQVPWGRLPAVLVTLGVGAAAFCCLGVAFTAAVPSQDAAAPMVNAVLMPLYFLSGVFIPESEIPDGVLHFADAFPVRHFFEAFFAAFTTSGGAGFEWGHLAVVAAWGGAGLLLALRTFRWVPRFG